MSISLVFVSCEKKADTESPNLEVSNSNEEKTFKYEKQVKVEDATKKYYIVVLFQSNSQELLEEAIRNKPYLTVGDFSNEVCNEVEQTIGNSNILESNSDIMYILTRDRNLPKGLSYAFHMSSNYRGPGCIPIEGDHIETAVFRDDLANEVYVANHGNDCDILVRIYTRGSKSWSSGFWYKRVEEYFPNPYAMLVDRRTYNSKKPGIKIIAEALYNLNGFSWYVTDSE